MKFLKNRKGASIIIYCISLTALIAVTSLVADIGLMVVQKNRVMNAVDASALAGAQELIYNPGAAISKAREYIAKNGIDIGGVNVELFDSNMGLRVTAQKDVNFFLARVLGFEGSVVSSTASAVVLPVSGVSGARPFAIEEQELIFGETYELKSGGGSGVSGNYGPVELGGQGARVYFNNIINR